MAVIPIIIVVKKIKREVPIIFNTLFFVAFIFDLFEDFFFSKIGAFSKKGYLVFLF